MEKSIVIKQLANNDISLDVALNRLLIIASDIGNDKLSEWAEKELTGYNSSDIIPIYRIVKNAPILYTGFKGLVQVRKAPLPLQAKELFGEKDKANIELCECIKSIQDVANSENGYKRDLTIFNGKVFELTGIQCISIYQIIPQNALMTVLNSTKTILIKTFIKLDKEYGNLDNLDIDTSKKTSKEIDQINTTINNYIYTDNSVTIGDKNKIEGTSIASGELKHETK